MSTIIFPSPIFGPVRSRRLGISLGINLMPSDGKICTFDCIYCECGFNKEHRPKLPRPSRKEVSTALRQQLIKMQSEGELPDVLTFAGNGEPTAHPDFSDIIDDTIALRDEFCPNAKVSVLSNATRAALPKVKQALLKVDNNILKLDTVNADYIRRVNQPTGLYDVNQVIEALIAYEGQLIIQTMFMKGCSHGVSVDNTGDEFVKPWIEALKQIKPRQVMIYTIDRETPEQGLLKATPEELDRIVALLEQEGFKASASY
ncbi:MAG: radical SAM protein [Bacteroidaceae bacterium]|nr:radical SAM protein [Bacteroidaceae bacterium]